MDMEDVLLCAAALLAEDERVAAQVRQQYKWFVVDEFQDVSPIQASLLDLWLGGRDDLCVVGDPAQTIYSFAGANASYLLDFPKKHDSTTSVELVRNYRSTPQVVDAANRLLSGTPSAGVQLRSQQESGAEVRFAEHSDEVAEAEQVAGEIRAMMDAGTPAREVAVLFRINAQSEAFEEAFAARGVPYVLRGAARFFERAEVKQAVTLLRGNARSGAGTGAELAAEVRAVLGGMGWAEKAPTGRGNVRDKWESLQAIVSQAEDFLTAQPESGLVDFVAELDRRAAEQHAPVAEGVTLATLHAAKGLEWDVVFVAGMHEGTMPIIYADTPAAVEEERRLLYVGMTRARQRLTVSWALARTPGGRSSRKPSRFLTGLRPQTASDSAPGAWLVGPQAQERRALPRVRQAAGHDRGAQGRSLRGLPGVLRRGAVRATPGLARRARGTGEGPGVRRVHRPHPAGDRGGQARESPVPAADQRHRPVQADEVRRRRARPRRRRDGRRRRRPGHPRRGLTGRSAWPDRASSRLRTENFSEIPKKSIAAYRAAPVSSLSFSPTPRTSALTQPALVSRRR